MADFEAEYQKLNAQQRQAVDHIDGPLLVIAGPGTGKTQLLSLRVANILKQTDTSPQNILCLTFTNKAMNNMRERLSSLAGVEGNRVPVRTFHSFAAELITLYPEYFWNGARLTPVPEAVQLEIITDILGELPLDNPLALKFAGNFTATKDVLEGLRLAKEAGLTPSKLRALIEFNLKYIEEIEEEFIALCARRLSYKQLDSLAESIDALPDQQIDQLTRPLISLATVIKESFQAARTADEGTNKTTNVSRWKTRWVGTVNGQKGMFSERKRNAWWLALADVYASYRDQLHARGHYDYADMIIEVISQLENHPDMLASAQERYLYVLIDEFQDTNAAQLRLAHLIADHYSAAGKPNIMAVGDDDQAIYKFNGAELSNMLDFRRSYPSAKIIVLTDNYRSSQAVLDFSDKLITQASERLTTREAEVKKLLTAANESRESGVIQHLSYPSKLHQYTGLAEQIAKTHQQGGSVAVLARGHESLRRVAAILWEQGVPIRYEQQQSILEQEVVRQIVLVAEIVDSLTNGEGDLVNEKIAQLLQHPVWGIAPETLWRLALKNRRNHDWIDSLLKNPETGVQNIAHWLLWLAQQSSIEPLPRMLEYIIGLKASQHLTSPLRDYFLRVPKNQKSIDAPFIATLSATHRLLDLTTEFSRHGQTTVHDFVRLIHVTEQNNQTITDESLFVTAPGAIELLTVHKAKGLEFDTVFLVDAQESIWRPVNRGRGAPANLPLGAHGDELDDYIRLMFVAVTRARKNIHITSFYASEQGEPVLPSGIIRDILPAKKLGVGEAESAQQVLEAGLSWPRLSGAQEKLLLARTLEDFRLSATALLNFLDVSRGGPAYFLERHLLRLPEATSVKVAFGKAMHATLERAQRLVGDGRFTLDEVLSFYETALSDQFLERAEHERYLLHGQQTLQRLFETYKLRLEQNGQAEVRFVDIALGPVRLRGDLDRVDKDNDTLTITDYKTGRALRSLATRDKTLQLKAWRQRTQLLFYTLLAQQSSEFSSAKTITTQILYIEAEDPKDLSLTFTPSTEDLQRLTRLIQIVWQKILSLNLPDVRHYDQSYDGVKQFEDDLLEGKV